MKSIHGSALIQSKSSISQCPSEYGRAGMRGEGVARGSGAGAVHADVPRAGTSEPQRTAAPETGNHPERRGKKMRRSSVIFSLLVLQDRVTFQNGFNSFLLDKHTLLWGGVFVSV